ncbi:Uncharacterised protein [Achromobacter sp. 2789STDY5608615]|nr:Uncharacterised protein [Achromobacter sp. 2789STDY5608615]
MSHDPPSPSALARRPIGAGRPGRAAGAGLRVHGPALCASRPAGGRRLPGAGRRRHRHARRGPHRLARLLRRPGAAGSHHRRAGVQPRPAHGALAGRGSARALRHPARRPVPHPWRAGRRHPRPHPRRPEPDRPAASGQPIPGRPGHGDLGTRFLGPRAQPEGRRAGKLPGVRRRRRGRHAEPGGAGGRRLPVAARTGRTPGADARDHRLARGIAAHLPPPLRSRFDLEAGPDPGRDPVAASPGARRRSGARTRHPGPRAGAADRQAAGAAAAASRPG